MQPGPGMAGVGDVWDRRWLGLEMAGYGDGRDHKWRDRKQPGPEAAELDGAGTGDGWDR